MAWVPADGKLMRRQGNGTWETLANAVLAHDVAADGNILYTVGGTIWLRQPDGKTEKVDRQAAVSDLTLLP